MKHVPGEFDRCMCGVFCRLDPDGDCPILTEQQEALEDEARKLGLVVADGRMKEAVACMASRLQKDAKGLVPEGNVWLDGTPRKGSMRYLEWVALSAGASFAVGMVDPQRKEVVLYVQTDYTPSNMATIERAVQLDAPAGVRVHVVPALPRVFTYVQKKEPQTFWQRLVFFFSGRRPTEVVRLNLE